jgi:Helicase associated domain
VQIDLDKISDLLSPGSRATLTWDPLESDWEQGFAELTKFQARVGHCNVPALHIQGTFKLGRWVSVHRTNRNKMSAERQQRLDAIGFVWDPLEGAWEKGFAALKIFHAREGHCRVPQFHIEGTFRLGTWVGGQRRRRDTMPAERRRRLDELGFVWRLEKATA